MRESSYDMRNFIFLHEFFFKFTINGCELGINPKVNLYFLCNAKSQELSE